MADIIPTVNSFIPYYNLNIVLTPKQHSVEDQVHVEEGGGDGRQAAHRLEGRVGQPPICRYVRGFYDWEWKAFCHLIF